MRRFLTLVCLIGLAIPAGISLEGCVRNTPGKYCNGVGYGLLDTAVASITLNPQIAGISLAYGQTTQAQTPTATTCKGDTVSVNSNSFTWGTTNNQLVDISPSGSICAGTWNRNTGGGIADYTYCNFPTPAPATGGLPYAVAYITATAESVTSNPVPVYIHAPVTSISLVGPSQCLSQTQSAQLDAEGCYAVNGTQYEMCAPASVSASGKYACPGGLAPGVKSVPACGSSIGTMGFNVGTASVASIDANTNVITAQQPGTTAITASIAQSASSAGYFSTCPPASISVTLPNGATSGTVAQGTPENLTTTILDTNGKTISGLALTYQSTNPIDITAAGSTSSIGTSFPGQASITAICQPGTCNPSPINEVGFNGTGLSISSNPVNITVPGTASDYVWFGAPGTSEYFEQIELLTGTISAAVRMPYVPNSMMMDRTGASLYFGSARELMIYSTSSNTLGTQATAAPGVVLAVAPDNSKALVNDQARHLFYLYSNGGIATFSGMGNAAAWTPDSQTLYITDNALLNTPATCATPLITGHTDTLYVFNANTGVSTYPLPPSPLPANVTVPCTAQPNEWNPTMAIEQTPAVMIPSVGAYLRGLLTEAHTWCPAGTVGNQATIQYYPQGGSEPVESDVLSATVEGHHILGVQWNAGDTITLNDIAVTVPPGLTTNGVQTPAACTVTTNPVTGAQTMNPMTIASSVNSVPVAGVSAQLVNQVVTGSTPVPASGGVGSSLAFITYSGGSSGAALPYYLPAPGSAVGTLGYVNVSSCPITNPSWPCASTNTAPVAGAFSPDNTLFFVSTSGDNMIHYISIPGTITPSTPLKDIEQVSPNLPACNPATDTGCVYNGSGTVVPATAIEVKPRSTT